MFFFLGDELLIEGEATFTLKASDLMFGHNMQRFMVDVKECLAAGHHHVGRFQ